MATTYKNLYPQIYAFENLYQAHRQARRGGKRKRPEVAEFEQNLGENLLTLQAELESGSYRPGPYRHFIVIERKERKISAAPYRDRVVHHARKVPPAMRGETLLQADAELETLKALLRLGQEQRYMSLRQYRHVSGLTANIGQQLGGWRKTTRG